MAAAVRRTGEVRPSNATFNAARGANLKPQSGLYARVTGNFTGTTDEIIQWAACKWGVDEDIVRAQVGQGVWWYQTPAGDCSTDATAAPPATRSAPTAGPASAPSRSGSMQVRYPYWRCGVPVGDVTSSAYNVDHALAASAQLLRGQRARG